MPNPFATADMAAGYASARPPVHARVLEHWRQRTAMDMPVDLAVDLGCGSGLSTRPLQPFARRSLGLEPAVAMVTHAARVAPGVWFGAASGERLPLRTASIDLVVAAGSLNYVRDLDACLHEVARVLRGDGRLLVYDFATARRASSGPWLDTWFDAFLTRYPAPASEARPLDPERLAALAPFEQADAAAFTLVVPMTREAYAAYMATETNVAAAVRDGHAIEDIRAWIGSSLTDAWPGDEQPIEFDAYWAELTPRLVSASAGRHARA